MDNASTGLKRSLAVISERGRAQPTESYYRNGQRAGPRSSCARFAAVSDAQVARRPSALGGINRNVVCLGIVSLLTAVPPEMIVPVMPLFVTAVLGASI